MSDNIQKMIIQLKSFLLIIVVVMLSLSCKKDKKTGFTADFNYEYIDDNNVRFTNTSEGEYYSVDWNFGNGETAETTDKVKSYTIYYPQSGDYNVTISVLDYTGNKQSETKTVTISKDDLVLSFTATINPAQPNYVNLENTSIGNYDSFKWIYRNKEIENETNVVAYFPFSGSYDIELQVKRGSETFSEMKRVNISSDDPDYFSSFTLTWADEFDGTEVNNSNWTFETGASGWGNNELQNYTNGDNVEVKDGKLIITAKKVNDNQTVGSYTSTRMITMDKQEFMYGRMEIRAKLPSGRGIWPAIWMLGADFKTAGWPACGEIDIMEYVGYQPNTIHATVHTPAGYGGNGDGSSKTLETAEEEFHIYGLIWTEKEIIFYTDTLENVTHRYAPSNKTEQNWPFDKPQFFIFNIAVGGNWGGAQGIDDNIFPQSMEIDYVRVYQPEN
jgi:beta-glucanase (GH16 family)